MLNAVLIDLDNTMVLFDEPRFYRHYFDRISSWFADLFPDGQFIDRLIRATRALKENNGRRPNVDHFMDSLCGVAHGASRERIWRRFIDFYREEYDHIRRRVAAPAGLAETLAFLASRPVKLVLASNPIFPELVHQKRMAWVGIDPVSPWSLITHIENMSYVKPRTGYFLEISRMIGVPPGQCLMVGNDPVNDMAAARAGMHTYLTTDGDETNYASLQMTVSRNDPPQRIAPDFSGPFRDLPRTVERLLAEDSRE